MGELLNSVPGSFYSYEPLTLFGINRIYDDSQLVPKAVNVIKNILKCNYSMVNYECKISITFSLGLLLYCFHTYYFKELPCPSHWMAGTNYNIPKLPMGN